MDTTKEITNNEDVIDSREIIERIEDLQNERDFFQEDNELENYPGYEQSDEDSKWVEWDESDEGQELYWLERVQEDAQGYSPDWRYGETLIRDSYFEDFTRQFLEDIGYISKDLPALIERNIDWSGVADDLKEDYTQVNFDGVDYWVRVG